MADVADDPIQQTLRTVIREEVTGNTFRRVIREEMASDTVRQVIREEVRPVVHEEMHGKEMRTVIREAVHGETDDIRTDVAIIKHVQGEQSILLRTLQSDVNSIKTGYRHMDKETRRLGVLLEDLDDRFKGASELYG